MKTLSFWRAITANLLVEYVNAPARRGRAPFVAKERDVGRSISRIAGILFRDARPLGGVCLAVVCALLAYWVRYAFIEPEPMGAACYVDAPWWCVLRTGLIVATEKNLLGLLAFAAAVLALLPSERLHLWSAHVALAIGGGGLILYNATFSVAAAVLALLVLALRRQGPA